MNFNLMKHTKIILAYLMMVTIVGCASKHTGKNRYGKSIKTSGPRYKQKHDSHPHPKDIPDLSKVKEPKPKFEPKSRYGNPPTYKVFNKTYRVLSSSGGYKERGYASWYGTKFHGFKTSNGEVYNMYSMTAAHKTLPLPTYVKVTNLHNKRSVIVKVNDRGPFHGNRIIDLSYAAATKLGMLGHGVGLVEISVVTDKSNKKGNSIPSDIIHNPKIQIAAFTNKTSAQKISSELESLLRTYKRLYKDQGRYRVNIIEDRLQNTNKKNILYKVVIDAVNKERSIKNLKKFLSNVPNQQIKMLAQSININKS